MADRWDDLRLPQGDEPLWELFHENSKTRPFDRFYPNEAVAERVGQLWESLPYAHLPRFDLPWALAEPGVSLMDAISQRTTARALRPAQLTMEQLATILFCAYGITRPNEGTIWPRAFRTVPSGGALYPLEIYFHSSLVEGLPAGIFHYNPKSSDVALQREGDYGDALSEASFFPDLGADPSLVLFITAVMERSTFKYEDRGYRFILLEAGHVAQNVNLAAQALGLGTVNVGGFYETKIDDLLGLDGLTHSTVYVAAVGEDASTGDDKPVMA